MKILKKLQSFRKTIVILASAVTIFSLVAPSVANALFIDDLTGLIEDSLSATNDITSPLLSVAPNVMKYYLISMICLAVSTSILEWEITNPDWMNLKGSMVTKGWELTRGLANMFLLLIFLIVAFGFILRIESLESQQALPRLVIVALLLNFSKLFVGMIVDIATIANNTIMYGHEKFLSTVMQGFITSMYAVFATMILKIIEDTIALAVPLGGMLKLAGMIASLAYRGLFISSMPTWIFQLVAASALTMIFCVYIILFAARVYIIQILAILSPLAFLCLILPQTKKYWDEWLKHLIQWCFVGTILLFFLMLGLYAGNSILPNVATFPTTQTIGAFVPLFNVPRYYLFYSFLFIYLAVSFWMVDRTMPMIAVAIMGMSQGLATKGWNKYGKDIKNDVVRRVNEKAAAHADRDKKVRDEDGNLNLQGAEKWKHRINSAALKPVFGAHRIFQTSPKMSMRKYQNADQENLETHFGKDEDGVDRAMETMASDPGLYRRMDTSKKLALMSYGMKYKGSDFVQDLDKKKVLNDTLAHAAIHNKSMVTKAAGFHPDILDRSERGVNLQEAILASESKAPDELARMSDIYMGAPQDANIRAKAAMSLASKKVLGNKENMDNWNKKALNNKDLQEAIVYNANSGDIQKIGEKQGQDTLDSIHDTFEQQGHNVFYGNKKLTRATATNPGVQETFASPQDVAQKKGKDKKLKYINDIIEVEATRRGHGPRPGGGGTGAGTGGPGPGGGGQQGGGAPGPGPGPGTGAGAGAGAGAGPGTPPGGGGGTTDRRTRARQPNQSDFGDFERGQTQQTTTPPNNNTAGRQTRTQQPNQSNLGDIGRGRDRQRTTENLRDIANRSFADFQRGGQAQSNPDGTPGSGISRSGRTDNVYPDDTTPPSRPGRGSPPADRA